MIQQLLRVTWERPPRFLLRSRFSDEDINYICTYSLVPVLLVNVVQLFPDEPPTSRIKIMKNIKRIKKYIKVYQEMYIKYIKRIKKIIKILYSQLEKRLLVPGMNRY